MIYENNLIINLCKYAKNRTYILHVFGKLDCSFLTSSLLNFAFLIWNEQYMQSHLSFALQGIYAVVTHLAFAQLVLPVTWDDSAMRCYAMRWRPFCCYPVIASSCSLNQVFFSFPAQQRCILRGKLVHYLNKLMKFIRRLILIVLRRNFL